MMLPSIRLSRDALSRFDESIQKEWLVTNGLGGYASSTVLGINTRKYHGLLVAALHPPGDRRVFLTKLDEDINLQNSVQRLGANEFQTGFFPSGHDFLREFSVSPFPKYVYEAQNVEIQKTIFMPHGKNAVVALYNVLNNNDADAKFLIYPITNGRDFHTVTNKSKAPMEFVQKRDDKKVEMSMQLSQPVLLMAATSGNYIAEGRWIERIYLREEAHRGESCYDDCYQPGHFELSIEARGNEDFAIVAVAEENEQSAREILAQLPSTTRDAKTLYEKETWRAQDFLSKFYDSHKAVSSSDWLSWLVLATNTFIAKAIDNAQKVVIAGYHWFGPWGRDTFVSLPGLVLVTGRFEDARNILLAFRKHCKKGLIPNFLSEGSGEPVYNTVDATLWYVNAVLQYLKYTGDFAFVQGQLWETLKNIIENHVKGTDFGIRVDVDGLLSHGPQLTWVDAAVDGKPVNPRAGKAVEVQALWYNALKTVEILANKFKEKNLVDKYAQLSGKARRNFAAEFWNVEKDCLFDVVGGNNHDGSLRPDQILITALDFVILDNAHNEKIVAAVQRELLTPCGLRTLEKIDSKYIGIYAGDRGNRDKAYHNGTVWPWLLGPLVTGFLKAKGHTDTAREYASRNFLLPLFTKQIFEGGLGSLNEISDGDPPHTPRGCISQAWSVAEPLRAYIEDVMLIRPKYEKEVLLSSR